MKFGYTIVYVSDVAASLAFFEKAFGLSRRFLHESGEFGELETGSTALAFVAHGTARASLGHDYLAADRSAEPLGIEIGLVTGEVEQACERALRSGAALLAAPLRKPWGQTIAYVRCPDGTLVELCTPMG